VDYHPGIAAVYQGADVPVVPVSLDSGLFWGRLAPIKYPGEITLRFLDPIPPGLDRKAFMARLYDAIEGDTARLIADKRARYPYLPPPKTGAAPAASPVENG